MTIIPSYCNLYCSYDSYYYSYETLNRSQAQQVHWKKKQLKVTCKHSIHPSLLHVLNQYNIFIFKGGFCSQFIHLTAVRVPIGSGISMCDIGTSSVWIQKSHWQSYMHVSMQMLGYKCASWGIKYVSVDWCTDWMYIHVNVVLVFMKEWAYIWILLIHIWKIIFLFMYI